MFEYKNYELYKGDCLEVMKTIESQSVDMILCDLPYGTTACKWDNVIPFEPLWEQYERIVRANGYIVLFGSQPFTTKLINSNINNFSHQWIWDKKMSANPLLAKKMPLKNFEDVCVFCFNYNQYDLRRKYFSLVLDYIKKTKKNIISEIGQCADHCFRVNSIQFDIPTKDTYDKIVNIYNLEKMNGFLTYEEININNRIYNPQMIKLDKPRTIGGGKYCNSDFMGNNLITSKKETQEAYPTSIICFTNRKGKGNSFHPTQKPTELLEYLIKTYTNENEIVLDNCMGSGSTGVACLNTNRKFIGIELDNDYFNIAKNRIEKTEILLDL